MMWIAWMGCSAVLVLAGGYAMRRGNVGVVKLYAGASALMFVLTVFKAGHAIGPAFAAWPWILCCSFAVAMVILGIVAVRRDRAEVMGTPGSREAMTTAAVIYGAGATHEGAGSESSGGAEM